MILTLRQILSKTSSFEIWGTRGEHDTYIEAPYRPHDLEGVMADNKPSLTAEPVWVTATRNVK